jgi:adenylate cyclase
MERRLTAILAADVVGYSSLMEKDEAGTYARLRAGRQELFEPEIARHHGRIFKLMGDGMMAEFGSVVDAVECAVALQRGLAQRNSSLPEEHQIEVRIGVNLGDVIIEGDDRYGDGVNIAARLEQLALPGSIYVSGKVVKEVERRLSLTFQQIGEQKMKNLAEPVQVYSVIIDSSAKRQAAARGKRPNWLFPAAGTAAATLAAAGIAAWFLLPRSPEAPPLPAGESIAVLPFANLSDDPKQDYFADGITDNLITDLSRLSGLFVTSRQSTLVYKSTTIDPRTVGRELGVRNILEGSVQRAGDMVRINAQLIDAATGGHKWAERYDGSMADIFGLQDRVTRAVVEALALQLNSGEQTAVAAQHESKVPEAYDAFLQGWELYQRSTPEGLAAAISYFERAVQLDPAYGRAQAALAMIYFRAYDERWAGKLFISSDDAFRKARDYLTLATVRPTSLSHQVAGSISRSRGWYEDAGKEFQAAIALDRSDPWSYAYLAYSLIYAGRAAEAEPQIETAMRLDPHYPPLFDFYQGLAQFAQNRMEEAAITLQKAAKANPDEPLPLLYLASSYGNLGRNREAADAIAAFSEARVRQGSLPFVMINVTDQPPLFRAPAGSPLIKGLLPLGLPYNFDDKTFDSWRLSAAEIEALFFGHRVHGRTLEWGTEHGASVSPDGVALMYGDWASGTGTARIEGDRVCFVWTTTQHCGQILRNPGGTKEKENEYLWYTGWAYTFSQVE